MLIYKWDDKTIGIGIEMIDDHHKKLINLLNELTEAIKNQKQYEIILDIFERLYDYTIYHFSAEEKLFTRLSKSDAELHKLQHKHFIEQLSEIKENSYKKPVSLDLLYFLTDWLVNHICSEDRKLTDNFE